MVIKAERMRPRFRATACQWMPVYPKVTDLPAEPLAPIRNRSEADSQRSEDGVGTGVGGITAEEPRQLPLAIALPAVDPKSANRSN